MAKTDYREILTQADIRTMRGALRDAIFLYSQPEAPPHAAAMRAKFEALLKKIHGAPVQQVMCLSGPVAPKESAK